MTELELSLESRTSAWMKAREELENKLGHITDDFKDSISDKEETLAQLHKSDETCQGLREELQLSKESYTELDVVKNQIQDQLLEQSEALVATKEELNQQITEKEKGLEKAEVNHIFC